MVKKLSFIFPLMLLGFCLVVGKSPLAEEEEPYRLDVGYVEWKSRPLKVVVEVADNRIERAIGLMFRKELSPGQGMLLQYPEEKILQIWMKEMLFPLDVIFISADGRDRIRRKKTTAVFRGTLREFLLDG